MVIGVDSTSDLTDALKTAVSGPSGFLGLALIVLGTLALKVIDQKDRPALRYTVFFLILVIALSGVGWSVYGHYTASANSVFVPAKAETSPPAIDGSASGANSQAPNSSAPRSPAASVASAQRIDCGQVWTGWVNVGSGVGDPCPSGCVRGNELGQSYRAVGFPPRPQTQHKFQCWRR